MAVKRILALWIIALNCILFAQRGGSSRIFCNFKAYFMHKILMRKITFHSGPKMLKSKQRGAGPKFIYHVKGGYIVISKNKIFFKSVEGKF